MTRDAPATVSYRSAIDSWLLMVLGGAILVTAISAGLVLMTGDTTASVIALVIGAIGIGLPLWILSSTSYTLTPEHLTIRSGPFRRRIPLADVRAISPSSSILSAPALSTKRLRIDCAGGGHVLVSPADPAAFVADLDARRGGLRPGPSASPP